MALFLGSYCPFFRLDWCDGLWFGLFSSFVVKNMRFGRKTFDLSFSPRSSYFPDFLPPPISSYFLSCFRLAYDSSGECFSSKINCQERTVPLRQLNFWHSKYQSGFLAILLFSYGVSFNKIVSVQQFFGDKVVSGRSRPFKAICLG